MAEHEVEEAPNGNLGDNHVEEKVCNEWTEELEKKLIKRVGKYLRKEENQSKTLKTMDWSQIKVSGFSVEDKRKKYLFLCRNIRKVRTASEVHQDLLSLPPPPHKQGRAPKRPTPFLSFYKDYLEKKKQGNPDVKASEIQAKASKKWNTMSAKRKNKYVVKCQSLMEKYDQEMARYMVNNPEYKTRFLPLPVPPKKPPISAFNLFKHQNYGKTCGSSTNKDFVVACKELSTQWRELDEDEKELWNKKLLAVKKEYEKKFKAYEDSLTEDQRTLLARKASQKNK